LRYRQGRSTVALFEAIGRGEFEGFTSDYTLGELRNADDPKKGDMLVLIGKYGLKTLPVSEEAERLADVYMSKDIIPRNKRLDALHIAVASGAALNYILSLNFKHINKPNVWWTW
jgi:hypothetical protein